MAWIMNRDEALAIIEREQLDGYVWFEEPTNKMEVVAIYRDGDEWVVLATNERATPEGVVRRFNEENSALENFIKRLRAGKRGAELLRRQRERKRSGLVDRTEK